MSKDRKREIIVGLDAGTTKICAAIGEIDSNGLNLLSLISLQSAGIRKGVVVDVSSASDSIKKVVDHARSQTGINITEAVVGITGSHIQNFNGQGAVGIKGKVITRDDVERVIDSAGALNIPLDREILHLFPTDFILDGNAVNDAVGLAGSRLEVKVTAVTGLTASIENLLNSCKKAGLEAADLVLQPIASAEAALTDEDREVGTALVDIGGGTADIAVYKNGLLRHVSVLGIGGNHIANDISIGMRMPFHESERVKKKIGTIYQSEKGDRDIEIVAADGQVRRMPEKSALEIIQPRCEELLELIGQEIEGLRNKGIVVSDVVFSGGTALLSGFDRMAREILSLPVRVGYPLSGAGNSSLIKACKGMAEFNSPLYTASIGLLIYGAEMAEIDKANYPARISGIFNKMAGLFKGIAGRR